MAAGGGKVAEGGPVDGRATMDDGVRRAQGRAMASGDDVAWQRAAKIAVVGCWLAGGGRLPLTDRQVHPVHGKRRKGFPIVKLMTAMVLDACVRAKPPPSVMIRALRG